MNEQHGNPMDQQPFDNNPNASGAGSNASDNQTPPNQGSPAYRQTGASHPYADSQQQYAQPQGRQYAQGGQPYPQGQQYAQPQGQPYPQGQYAPYGGQVPPQGLYYPPSVNAQWNVMCIVGFILAFLLPPVGLILSIIALVQINRTREKNKGMAIAGIIIGAFETLLYVIIFIFVAWGIGMAIDNSDQWSSDLNSACTSGDCSWSSDSKTAGLPQSSDHLGTQIAALMAQR